MMYVKFFPPTNLLIEFENFLYFWYGIITPPFSQFARLTYSHSRKMACEQLWPPKVVRGWSVGYYNLQDTS